MKGYKKLLAGTLASAMLITSGAAVMAEEMLISPMPISAPISPAQTNTVITVTTVDGTPVNLTAYEIFEDNGNVMVPLRMLAETMGFEVAWNDDQTIAMDNGEVKTTLKIGEDSYYKASSKAIGLTQAVPFGSAPVLYNDSTTYVPLRLLNLLLSNDDAVTIDGNSLHIVTVAE